LDIAQVETDDAPSRDELRYRLNRACDRRECRIVERGRGCRPKAAVREPQQRCRGSTAKKKSASRDPHVAFSGVGARDHLPKLVSVDRACAASGFAAGATDGSLEQYPEERAGK
jgi:hypothetical protein